MKKKTEFLKSQWQAIVDKEHPKLLRLTEDFADGKGPNYLNVKKCEILARAARLFLECAHSFASSPDAAAAAYFAFHAGRCQSELSATLPLARLAVIGHERVQHGKKWNEAVYGTKKERDAAHAEWQQMIDSLVAGGMSYNSALPNVARKVGVSPETVKNYTHNPKPRHKKVG